MLKTGERVGYGDLCSSPGQICLRLFNSAWSYKLVHPFRLTYALAISFFSSSSQCQHHSPAFPNDQWFEITGEVKAWGS